MASGQTNNYGLNQWAAEDQVIRTEFNEDNLRIDEALKNKLELVPIKSITATEATKNLVLDVSNIDWSQWRYVVMESVITAEGGGTIYLSPNKEENGIIWALGSLNFNYSGIGTLDYFRTNQTIFFPFFDDQRGISCMSINGTFNFGIASQTKYADVSTFYITAIGNSEAIQPGSAFSFFGMH